MQIPAACSTSCLSVFPPLFVSQPLLGLQSVFSSSDSLLFFFLSFRFFPLSFASSAANRGDGAFLTFPSLSAGVQKNVPSVGLKGRLHQSVGPRKWIIRRQSGDKSVKEEISFKWKDEIFLREKKSIKSDFCVSGSPKTFLLLSFM